MSLKRHFSWFENDGLTDNVKNLDSILIYTRIKAKLAPEVTKKWLFCLNYCFDQNFISRELLVVSGWLTTHFIQHT